MTGPERDVLTVLSRVPCPGPIHLTWLLNDPRPCRWCPVPRADPPAPVPLKSRRAVERVLAGLVARRLVVHKFAGTSIGYYTTGAA